MAHNLNYNDQTGKYSFYTLKEKAWHGYGQISDKSLSSREVLMQSQLDYPVVKSPHKYEMPSGRIIISDNSFYTFRADTEEIICRFTKR